MRQSKYCYVILNVRFGALKINKTQMIGVLLHVPNLTDAGCLIL